MHYTQAVLLFLVTVVLSSCTAGRSKTIDNSSNSSEYLSSANAEGFEGAEGEGFAGFISPKISTLIVPSAFNLQKGTVVTLKGSDFLEGIKLQISGVDCTVLSLLDSTSLRCSLVEAVAKITTVIAVNKTGEATTTTPQILIDTDGDTFTDESDNCPVDYQTDQLDKDQDGVGDYCDGDTRDSDDDGVLDQLDNCPAVENADQMDTWGTGIGDACNAKFTDDEDQDGSINGEDNCREVFNPGQQDIDNDSIGDACDPDLFID